MKHRSLKRWLVLAALFAVSLYAWAVTQTQLDRATACCWTGDWGGYCDTWGACGNGATCCKSSYFNDLGIAPNGYLSCSVFIGGSSSTQSASTLTGITGGAPEASAAPLFTVDGMLNVDTLGAAACTAPPTAGALLASGGPVTHSEAPVATDELNAPDASVERLFLQENEDASPPVIGFLPFNDRFAVADDHLYAIGWSEDKGYELVDVRDVGGPIVRDLNPQGSSFAGYPQYDGRTIKAFDGKLFFYAKQANGQIEMSSLKAGSALQDVNADPSGSDIPQVYANAGGDLTFQSYFIDKFEVLRGTLMSAGSRRVPVELPEGLNLGEIRQYDIEPERIHAGHVPQAEIIDTYPDGPSLPRNMVEFNGAVYMIAKVAGGYAPCAEDRDYQLLKLNDDGTSEVIVVNPDGWGFYPDVDYPPMHVHAGNLYFVANQGPPGDERHELMRLDSDDQVSVVPINPDGGAFPNVDEMWWFAVNWDALTPALVPLGDSLYVLGANVSGSCTGGCADPYVEKIVKIDSAGAVSVIDPTNPDGSFMSWDPQYFQTRFVSAAFGGDLYFWCGFCNDQGLYRLNGDDSVDYFSQWTVAPMSGGLNESIIGVQRGEHLYMFSDFFQFDPVFVHVARLIRVDTDGSITPLTSPDFGYEYVYSMVLLGDTLVAGANIFSDPEPDYDTNFLGSELLFIHPDDSLGYVDVAPGFDPDGYAYSAFPYGLTVVGDSVIFASYTDPNYESPFYEMFRLQLGGKGKGPKNQAASAALDWADIAGRTAPETRAWPAARPPATARFQSLGTAAAQSRAGRPPAFLQQAARANLNRKPRLPQGNLKEGFDLADYRTLEYQRLGPGAEVFKAQLRRQAEARAKARVTAGSCSSHLD